MKPTRMTKSPSRNSCPTASRITAESSDSTKDLRKENAHESDPGSDDLKSSPTTTGRAVATVAAPTLETTLAKMAAQLLKTVTVCQTD